MNRLASHSLEVNLAVNWNLRNCVGMLSVQEFAADGIL
jgi:hypothetical protein